MQGETQVIKPQDKSDSLQGETQVIKSQDKSTNHRTSLILWRAGQVIKPQEKSDSLVTLKVTTDDAGNGRRSVKNETEWAGKAVMREMEIWQSVKQVKINSDLQA